MPNWCDDSLTITGPKEDLERFVKKYNKDDGDALRFSDRASSFTWKIKDGEVNVRFQSAWARRMTTAWGTSLKSSPRA